MKNNLTPELVVLYRWKLKPGKEEQFIQNWSRVTETLRGHGSLGSRLHKGSDDVWYGYAQWPNAASRETAFATLAAMPGSDEMQEAIAQSYPEIVLDPVADYLILPSKA